VAVWEAGDDLQSSQPMIDAANLIEQQAARIAELEARVAASNEAIAMLITTGDELQASLDRLHGAKFSDRDYTAMVSKITALESERDALLAAAGKEAVAIYQLRETRSAGRPWVDTTKEWAEMRASEGKHEMRVVYTAPTAALEKSSDALYTMDQMRDYALAFHKSRLDARGDLTAKQKWDIAERVHSQCEALKPHATFRSAASQAINDTIAALSQKAGEKDD
jgi:uncharacterized coiled-coil protein SlyX